MQNYLYFNLFQESEKPATKRLCHKKDVSKIETHDVECDVESQQDEPNALPDNTGPGTSDLTATPPASLKKFKPRSKI